MSVRLYIAEDADPDVVVMDLKLPGIDGLETATRVRELRPGQQIILYSAYVDADVERRAREAGVAVCVPKLSGVEALAREISAVAVDLGRWSMRRGTLVTLIVLLALVAAVAVYQIPL